MDIDRQALVDERDALKLSAEIASKARRSAIVNFVEDIISKNGCDEYVKICLGDNLDNNIYKYPSRVSCTCKHIHFMNIDFMVNPDRTLYAKATITGYDYTPIYSTSHNANDITNICHMMFMKFVMCFIGSLDSLDILLNSDEFNAYKKDISQYLAVQDAIHEYDYRSFNKKKDIIKESFKVGMRIKTGSSSANANECLITKVCKKRMYVDNYKRFFNRPCQKTMDKDEAAYLIANGNWSLI